MNLRDLLRLGTICIEEAIYYGKTAAVAGRVVGFRSEENEIYLDLAASGTKNEELLRVLTGREDKRIAVHLCSADCKALVTDETLVHAHDFEEVAADRVPWLTNLKKVGEESRRHMRRMRWLSCAWSSAGWRVQRRRQTGEEKQQEKKRKKKEEKEEGRRSKSPKSERDELDFGQKSLEAVYKDTGMDPNPKRRGRLMKKARSLLAKGKRKRRRRKAAAAKVILPSSSSSKGALEDGLFDEEQKLQTVWRRYPGTLTARSLQEIKRSLVTSAGTMWNVDRSSLPPLYTQYGRQVVIPSMSPSLQQEALTLCQALDYFIQGRVAGGVDILNQRLKRIVALSKKGAHWTLGRQYELVKIEERGFAEEGEVLAAARRAKEDEKLRGLMSRSSSGKGV